MHGAAAIGRLLARRSGGEAGQVQQDPTEYKSAGSAWQRAYGRAFGKPKPRLGLGSARKSMSQWLSEAGYSWFDPDQGHWWLVDKRHHEEGPLHQNDHRGGPGDQEGLLRAPSGALRSQAMNDYAAQCVAVRAVPNFPPPPLRRQDAWVWRDYMAAYITGYVCITATMLVRGPEARALSYSIQWSA